MALTIITTAGATTANSYCDIDTADALHETNIYSVWQQIEPVKKTASLIHATRLLDEQCDWFGYKADEDQALEWPRDSVVDKNGYSVDSDIIPIFVQNATAELARLLNISDITEPADTRGFKKLKVDVLEMEIDKGDRMGVLPDRVWAMVRHYATKTSKTIKLLRV